ncbi:hypothetical protein GCM10009096_26970 [Parasphingorhabdus litoris]|uniref:Stability/partitioning determinant n=2 Tax=Parasphingorhabdus litoris TaxID=394733 RepID=A0ABN1ASY2_9SPHN
MAFPTQSDHENEDLGWNDMGYDANPDHNAAPSEEQGPVDADQYHYNPLAGAIPEAVPAVKKQQEEIAAKLSQHPTREAEVAEPEPAPQAQPVAEEPAVPVPLSISREVAPVAENSSIGVAPPPRKKAAEAKKAPKTRRPAQKSRTRKAKAAFTLRLDADRHLKLRLATAVKNVSAQQLVTKAVDEYLRTIPELDDLAERIPSRGAA